MRVLYLCLLLILAGCTGAPTLDSMGVFNSVTGSNLNDRSYELPGDFETEWSLVLLGYEKWHQLQVDTWLAVSPEIEKRYGVRYYELPTLERLTAEKRDRLDGMMKVAIPSEDTRDRTITLYIDREPFLRALDIDSTADMHALLVNRRGDVVWKHRGQHSPEAERDLVSVLERLFPTESG